MSVDNFNPLLYTLFREGTSDDPYIDRYEEKQVYNGQVRLTEIPQQQERVTVTSSDNSLWYEIDDGIPNENQYLVDYTNGMVFFNIEANEGKTLTFQYKGIGQIYIKSDLVYSSINPDGTIEDTLQSILDQNRIYGNVSHKLAPVTNYSDIATTYPLPIKGDMVEVTSENKMYIWNGTTWQWFLTFPFDQVMQNKQDISALNISLSNTNQQLTNLQNDYEINKTTIYNRLSDIFINVKSYGAKGDGLTDDYNDLLSASSQDNLLITNGVYVVGTNITFEKGVTFAKGAILKPKENVVIKFYGEVQAGMYQIFDCSLGGSIGGNPVIKEIYPEWFGAKPNRHITFNYNNQLKDDYDIDLSNTQDCTRAIKDAVTFWESDNQAYPFGKYIKRKPPIYFSQGLWKITDTIILTNSFNAPMIKTAGRDNTYFDYSSFTDDEKPCILYNGGSGEYTHKSSLSGICFNGSDVSVAIEFRGILGIHVKECRFNKNGIGVKFNNNQSGSYTEDCVIEDSYFSNSCKIKAKFTRGDGDASVHGSGIKNCWIDHDFTNNPVIYNDGMNWYNAECSMTIMGHGLPNNCVIQNNGTSQIFGDIRVESSSIITLGGGNRINFQGSLMAWGNNRIHLGTFYRVKYARNNTNGISEIFDTRNITQNLTTGDNLIDERIMVYQILPYLISLRLTAPNYDIRFLLSACASSSAGDGGNVTILSAWTRVAGDGYYSPTFSIDSDGYLHIINDDFPVSGVKAWITISPFIGSSTLYTDYD